MGFNDTHEHFMKNGFPPACTTAEFIDEITWTPAFTANVEAATRALLAGADPREVHEQYGKFVLYAAKSRAEKHNPGSRAPQEGRRADQCSDIKPEEGDGTGGVQPAVNNAAPHADTAAHSAARWTSGYSAGPEALARPARRGPHSAR